MIPEEKEGWEYNWTGLPEQISDYILQNGPNPLAHRTPEEYQQAGLREMLLFYNSSYMYYTANVLLGLEISPFQAVILDMFWRHSFPMLIASRGASKCSPGHTKIWTENGVQTLKDLCAVDIPHIKQRDFENLKIWGENGWSPLDYSFYNGVSKTKKIITKSGYEIEGTYNHPIRVIDGENIVWKNIEDIKIGDIVPINRKYSHNYKYNNLDSDVAYMIGALVGDGCYSVKSSGLRFTNKDSECIYYVNKGLQKYKQRNLKRCKNPIQWSAGGVQIKQDFIQDFECNSYDQYSYKATPNIIWSASPAAIAQYLSGLFDTDGCCTKSWVELSNKSEQLIDDCMQLLLMLGIISRKKRQYNKKHSKYYYKLIVSGPSLRLFQNLINFKISYKQHRLNKICSAKSNPNLDCVPTQLIGPKIKRLRELARDTLYYTKYSNSDIKLMSPNRLKSYNINYDNLNKIIKMLEASRAASLSSDLQDLKTINDNHYFYDVVDKISNNFQPTYDVHLKSDHSFISNGFISHNSFCAATYALLRAFLNPGSKIVVCGAAFRQSRLIFDTIENIWLKAPILRDLCDGNSGTKKNQDMWQFRINDSMIYAIPIGCLASNTFITGQNGIEFIDKCRDDKIWCRDKFKAVGQRYKMGPKPAATVKTRAGFEYTGTLNHKMKVWRNNEETWVRTDEMKVGDFVLIDKSERWYSPSFDCTDDQAYALGLMIGDGMYKNQYFLRYTTADKELLECLNANIGYFKQQNDIIHYQFSSKNKRREWIEFWDISEEHMSTYNKRIPKNLLRAPKSAAAACLSGLFDSDGHVSVKAGKDNSTQIEVGFSNTSKVLVRQIQYMLTHFGIVSRIYSRHRKPHHPSYELKIYNDDIIKFRDLINFRLKRKKDILEAGIKKKSRWNNIANCLPVDKKLLLEIVEKNKMGGKHFFYKKIDSRKNITHSYLTRFLEECKKRKIDHPNIKILEKLVDPNIFFDYIIDIHKEPDLVDVYDFNVPDDHMYSASGFISHNTGETIRGLRANVVIADEFDAINTEIYEIVVKNFGAVSLDPVNEMKRVSRVSAMRERGIDVPKELADGGFKNQSIIMGTMGFEFNPLYQYWHKYNTIIENKGLIDGHQMKSWREFVVLRMPCEMIPQGFMSDDTIEAARVTMHPAYFNSEFGCVPITDTEGFFRRTMIESCVARPSNIQDDVKWPKWCPSTFDVRLKGDPDKRYVMGVDPAAEDDNLAITILELHPEHSRLVYCWTVNKKKLAAQQFGDKVKNYYKYVARKIRNLMADFNIDHIGIDAQGGGGALAEALQDEGALKEGEVPLWPFIDPNKAQDTDNYPGLHILHMIQFAKADWTSQSNHGMLKDLQNKTLLFPDYNTILMGLAGLQKATGASSIYSDSEEDCLEEIEELKKELSTIVYTKTAHREKWDTPEIKMADGTKTNLKKDRYSALLIANAIAREYNRFVPDTAIDVGGGVVGAIDNVYNQPMYKGNSERAKKMQSPDLFRLVGN